MKVLLKTGLWIILILTALSCQLLATTVSLQVNKTDFSDRTDIQAQPKFNWDTPLNNTDEWYNRAYNHLWKTSQLPQKQSQPMVPTPTLDFKNHHFLVLPDSDTNRIWFHWKKINIPRLRIDIFDISGERITALYQNSAHQKISWQLHESQFGIFYYRFVLLGHKEEYLPLKKIVIFH